MPCASKDKKKRVQESGAVVGRCGDSGGTERELHVFLSRKPDRTFEIKIGQPTVSYFLKAAAGIEKGARNTGE